MKKTAFLSCTILVLFAFALIAQQTATPAKEPTQQQMKEIQSQLNAAKDPAKKIDILKKFLDQFPESNVKASAYNYILRLYVNDLKDKAQAVAFSEQILKTEKIEANKTAAYIFLFNHYLENNTEQAAKMANQILTLDIRDSNLYDGIALSLADKNTALDVAENLSKKSLSISTLENLKNHPRYRGAPEDYLKRVLNDNNGYYNDTLGWIYFKQGKSQKAIEHLQKAITLSTKDFIGLPFTANALYHIGKVYMKTGENEKALPLLTEASMISEKEEIRSALNQSYQNKFGSTEGLDSYIMEQQRKLAKPAPDFTLKNLKGKDISLSSFKGKVVLLNFFSPT